MSKLCWVISLVGLLGLQACSKHWAEEDMEFTSGCWNMADTLTLEFDNSDTSTVYQLGFNVTLTEDYPFNNIYLKALLKAPSGDESVIPNEFVLSDRAGAWLSEPSGDEIPFELKMAEGLRFNQTGKYSLRLFHFMRQGELCGVEDAAIVLDLVE